MAFALISIAVCSVATPITAHCLQNKYKAALVPILGTAIAALVCL